MEIIENPDVDKWSEFVYNHPKGNIFQTPEMAEVYRRTKNYEPKALAALDDNGELIGILLAVVIKEVGGLLSPFSTRAVIHGGPLVVEDEKSINAIESLINHFEKEVKERTLYTLVRNLTDTSFVSPSLKNSNYVFEDHVNFLINLNRPEEEIWQGIQRSKRKGINKAKKEGVTVEEVEERSELPLIYNILDDTYKKAKIPLADISLFKSIFDILVSEEMAKFYIAKYNGKYVGVRLVNTYKGVIFDWYAGTLVEYLSKRVNEALVWHILKYGSKNNYVTFDFGGAGNPNEEYGVREFKREFGGDMVNFGRYVKINSPIKMVLAEKGFKLFRSIFGRVK